MGRCEANLSPFPFREQEGILVRDGLCSRHRPTPQPTTDPLMCRGGWHWVPALSNLGGWILFRENLLSTKGVRPLKPEGGPVLLCSNLLVVCIPHRARGKVLQDLDALRLFGFLLLLSLPHAFQTPPLLCCALNATEPLYPLSCLECFLETSTWLHPHVPSISAQMLPPHIPILCCAFQSSDHPGHNVFHFSVGAVSGMKAPRRKASCSPV